MNQQFDIQSYLKFVQFIEGSFSEFLIPVVRLKQQLKAASNLNVSDDAPVIKLLQDFPKEIAKVKVPLCFEYCAHAQKAGEGWIEDVKKRTLLVKMIKYQTEEALGQMAISPAMVSSQPKLIEALRGFELTAKLGRDLEKFPSWNNMVLSLTTEAATLSSAKSTPKTKSKKR